MLRRSILALSHRRINIGRIPSQDYARQVSPFVYTRREFSSVRQQNVSPQPGSPRKPPESGSNLSIVLVGSLAVGACFIAAYSTGYLDDILTKKQQSSVDPAELRADSENIEGMKPVHTGEDLISSRPDVENLKKSTERQSIMDPHEDPSKLEGEGEGEVSAISSSHFKSGEESTHAKVEELPSSDDVHSKMEELPKSSSLNEAVVDESVINRKIENSADKESPGQKVSNERQDVEEHLQKISEVDTVIQGNNMTENLTVELKSEGEPKDGSTSLLDAYSLRDNVDERASTSSESVIKHSSPREEVLTGASEGLSDAYLSKDGKLILDFLQAIHAAEQRQAELDARIFSEEKRLMKEKFEKELKDARARELMYAEEVAMLEKEVKKERAKAAAALKSLQERFEQRLKMELEEKDREAGSKLKELEEFAKAELAASIAREKAAQVEKMAEADLNINALCMAFYARSEEARKTHSIHKLALGALALEDALSNGLPVQGELDALRKYLDVDKDSLLQLALSSLPDEVRLYGADSLLQLHEKFDALKGPLRHFSLIPPNGGGILAHSLAHIASFLKVKEGDRSGDGIESLINKVESMLAQGKLVEAANALEDGVKGSKAAEVVSDWLRRARNRAIAEQALVLLQSYATSVSLS